MNRRLPVTLVGGFLGSGKTSLLHHFLTEQAAGPVAIFVEGAGAFNPDARSLRGLRGAMRRTQDIVAELPSENEDAQLAWLNEKLGEISGEGRHDRVLIEIGGTTNAARLGRKLATEPAIELREIVCVVDALDFYHGVVVPSRGGVPGDFASFQESQIRGASLLVLNKCDLLGEKERTACLELLALLNHGASLVETAYGELPPNVWNRPRDPEALSLALREADEGPSSEYDLSVTVYRVHRPFHPQRFWNWFDADHRGLLRVKGIVWLATRNLLVGGISRTRMQNSCGGAGIWWAALPREEWPTDVAALAQMQETWREPYGDRRQELFLIGDAATIPQITRDLAGCLLTDEEYARSVSEWREFADPFPTWDIGEPS